MLLYRKLGPKLVIIEVLLFVFDAWVFERFFVFSAAILSI